MIPMEGGIPQYGGYDNASYGGNYTGGQGMEIGGGGSGFNFAGLAGMGGSGGKKNKFQQMQGDQHVQGYDSGPLGPTGSYAPIDMNSFSGFLRYLSLLNSVMGLR